MRVMYSIAGLCSDAGSVFYFSRVLNVDAYFFHVVYNYPANNSEQDCAIPLLLPHQSQNFGMEPTYYSEGWTAVHSRLW